MELQKGQEAPELFRLSDMPMEVGRRGHSGFGLSVGEWREGGSSMLGLRL